MSPFRILVVDDDARMLRSVERVLSSEYTVSGTRLPAEAVEVAKAFKPDLAILDIQMPDLDGFQLMEHLQNIDPRIDVILMTGSIHEVDAKLIRAIRNNAFYFLQKPFDRGVLLTLIERCLELRRSNIQNRNYLQRIESELAEARAFQKSLLPAEHGRVGRVSISAQCVPCSELAGDFYDYVAAGPDVVLLVADVSGHGVCSAMLTGVVKSAFRSAVAENYEPASVVERVSSGIRSFSAHHFVTLICARIRGDTLHYVNAGHPPGILSGVEACSAALGATGPIISPSFSNFVWEQHTLPIRKGSRIVLFTDGILETESESGEYGLERLLEQVKNSPAEPRTLSQYILQDVRQFAGGRPIHDDLTLVVADLDL
jgi:sigma-B regulation protein RsbU (phosphoserine phosphatase)